MAFLASLRNVLMNAVNNQIGIAVKLACIQLESNEEFQPENDLI